MLFDKLLKGLEEKAAQVPLSSAARFQLYNVSSRIANLAYAQAFAQIQRMRPLLLMSRILVRNFYEKAHAMRFHLYTFSAPSLNPDVPQDEQQIARKVHALKNRLRGRGVRRGGRGGRTELAINRDNATESE